MSKLERDRTRVNWRSRFSTALAFAGAHPTLVTVAIISAMILMLSMTTAGGIQVEHLTVNLNLGIRGR